VEYAMKLGKGTTVLELGAGNGENALLIALAGAKRVYVNDIQEEHLLPLREDLQGLPDDYQKRMFLVPGDCLNLKNHPDLQQSCDLIIARNLVHFFVGEKKEQLFEMIARLLKPGGQVLISVNAPFAQLPRELIEEYPDTVFFYKLTPVVRINGELGKRFLGIGQVSASDEITVDPLKYNFEPLVSFIREGMRLHVIFHSFSEENKQEIFAYAQKLIARYGISQLLENHVQIICHCGYLVFHSKRTLPRLLSNLPLQPIHSLYTKVDGHIAEGEENAAGLTVILKKEIDKACFTCGKKTDQLCSGCKESYFCGKECQLAGWPQHKSECNR
jgi:SAM-dependent methyltransferase